MSSILRSSAALLLALSTAVGCSTEAEDANAGTDAITSNDGAVLEFRFSGEVVASSGTPARQAIVTQLQYVQGLLTRNERANGQIGLVELSDIRESRSGFGKTKFTYAASLPVAWPKGGSPVPTSYELALPRDVTKLDEFNAKYDGSCGSNAYGQETFWHDYNPKAPTCRTGSDVVSSNAAVRPHPSSTAGKFPEYNRVWGDDALDIVAVFGIISSNTPDDEGAREIEAVVRDIGETLTGSHRTDNTPGPSVIKDVTLTGSVDVDGRPRRVTLNAMLVQEVAAVGPDFDERFGAASENADFVVYSGHSGLGANINALAAKSRVKKDKYQLVYLNGCQTFAYLGTGLTDKKIAANGIDRDPRGTKDLDIVANALPSYGDNGATIITLYSAMRDYKHAPKTYNALLEDFSRLHLVAVFGEDDNAFTP